MFFEQRFTHFLWQNKKLNPNRWVALFYHLFEKKRRITSTESDQQYQHILFDIPQEVDCALDENASRREHMFRISGKKELPQVHCNDKYIGVSVPYSFFIDKCWLSCRTVLYLQTVPLFLRTSSEGRERKRKRESISFWIENIIYLIFSVFEFTFELDMV
jgi:hypothetical protein